MPATRVAHKFSGIWLLISVYSLIRRYERPAPSQRTEERNAWIALARDTKDGREMNVDTECKVRKVTWTLLPPLTREQPYTGLAHPSVSAIFLLRDLCLAESVQ